MLHEIADVEMDSSFNVFIYGEPVCWCVDSCIETWFSWIQLYTHCQVKFNDVRISSRCGEYHLDVVGQNVAVNDLSPALQECSDITEFLHLGILVLPHCNITPSHKKGFDALTYH